MHPHPLHPLPISALGILHFKKSDRSGEGLVLNKETGLVLEEPKSWQFMSVTNDMRNECLVLMQQHKLSNILKYYRTGDSYNLSPRITCKFKQEIQIHSNRNTQRTTLRSKEKCTFQGRKQIQQGQASMSEPGTGERECRLKDTCEIQRCIQQLRRG